MIGGLFLVAVVAFYAGRRTKQKELDDRDVELDYLRSLRNASEDRWRL